VITAVQRVDPLNRAEPLIDGDRAGTRSPDASSMPGRAPTPSTMTASPDLARTCPRAERSAAVGAAGRPRGEDAGFSLIELIVVMLVIGILAGIAIPVILDQRQKANDAATRSDVNQVGKRVVEYWLGGATPPVVEISAGRYVVAGEDLGKVSPNVVVAGASPTTVDTTGWTAGAWCLALTNPNGSLAAVRFSAQQGLETGGCSSPTAP